MNLNAQRLLIETGSADPVSGLLIRQPEARVCFVFAHGAGAGMNHPFMEMFATGLDARGIATLRYQFPYMEKGSRRPDPPAVAQATVRAAVVEAAKCIPGLVLIAGGKSFGGRMTSQAQAKAPLPGVRALAFLGFPLHAPKRPGRERAAHLNDVTVPMLFLQGTRDDLADLPLMKEVGHDLGERATLHVVDTANHSFEVLKKAGLSSAEVRAHLAETMRSWMDRIGP